MTKRKFYKATFVLVVLGEEPFTGNETIKDLVGAIDDGPCSGVFKMKKQETLDGRQAAKALIAQGSDPEFFCISARGNELPLSEF